MDMQKASSPDTRLLVKTDNRSLTTCEQCTAFLRAVAAVFSTSFSFLYSIVRIPFTSLGDRCVSTVNADSRKSKNCYTTKTECLGKTFTQTQNVGDLRNLLNNWDKSEYGNAFLRGDFASALETAKIHLFANKNVEERNISVAKLEALLEYRIWCGEMLGGNEKRLLELCRDFVQNYGTQEDRLNAVKGLRIGNKVASNYRSLIQQVRGHERFTIQGEERDAYSVFNRFGCLQEASNEASLIKAVRFAAGFQEYKQAANRCKSLSHAVSLYVFCQHCTGRWCGEGDDSTCRDELLAAADKLASEPVSEH